MVTVDTVERQAHVDGFRNGRTDYLLGQQSSYSWNCALDYGSRYSRAYGLGYREGWNLARDTERAQRIVLNQRITQPKGLK